MKVKKGIRGFLFLKRASYIPPPSIKNKLEKVRILKVREKIRIELYCYQTSFALDCEGSLTGNPRGDTSIFIKQFSK